MDEEEPPEDPLDNVVPLRLSGSDFKPQDRPCEPGEHEFREIGHGRAVGRCSNGNEYVENRCIYCGLVIDSYWTGGVL